MQLQEARDLIYNDVFTQQPEKAQWADLGCGPGLFSYALSALLPADATIYAIDKEPVFDSGMFPGQGKNIQPLLYDFAVDTLPFQQLDGLLIANALHYVADKPTLMQHLRDYLKPGASILVVEYDIAIPVPVWVPYPLSFTALSALCRDQGLAAPVRLQERPSSFGRGNLYAARMRL